MTGTLERAARPVAASVAVAGLVLVGGAAMIWGAEGFPTLPTSSQLPCPSVYGTKRSASATAPISAHHP